MSWTRRPTAWRSPSAKPRAFTPLPKLFATLITPNRIVTLEAKHAHQQGPDHHASPAHEPGPGLGPPRLHRGPDAHGHRAAGAGPEAGQGGNRRLLRLRGL